MAFIRYQNVRNRVLGAVAVVGAAIGGIFGYQSMAESGGRIDPATGRSAGSNWEERSALQSNEPAPRAKTVSQLNTPKANSEVQKKAPAARQKLSKADQYVLAMKFANFDSRKATKAKDILGSASPWKLNLYDDNQDGQWDRGKLDTNRDEVIDESWTFKNGSWEKDDGRLVWSGNQWVTRSKLVSGEAKASDADRYRAALKIANARANRSGKGKDVLGQGSPWKLNLYDDNQDGQWDRGKLDTNRDEVDDEKWNFKNGRWEKNGGDLVWAQNHWVKADSIKQPVLATAIDRYRAAFKIASARADSSGKGKDVLGAKSPWKLNLYDDDRNGQWDRAKLDINRDDVDDEKWTFKNSRWEKEGGTQFWTGVQWQSVKAVAAVIEEAPNSSFYRYRHAIKLAGGRANADGKGKDVLGSSSPWKLNLYDDDRNGTWDRAKLDTNRDDVDDEKWNFKNGRWEKDGGASIWDGKQWVKGQR